MPDCDSSLPAKDSPEMRIPDSRVAAIHPFLRRAAGFIKWLIFFDCDSSLPAKGSASIRRQSVMKPRFIPSCEGQPSLSSTPRKYDSIHPFLRRAAICCLIVRFVLDDSSLPAKGSHLVFMRLSAALNTSLCNLHKFCFQLVTHHFLYMM